MNYLIIIVFDTQTAQREEGRHHRLSRQTYNHDNLRIEMVEFSSLGGRLIIDYNADGSILSLKDDNANQTLFSGGIENYDRTIILLDHGATCHSNSGHIYIMEIKLICNRDHYNPIDLTPTIRRDAPYDRWMDHPLPECAGRVYIGKIRNDLGDLVVSIRNNNWQDFKEKLSLQNQ